MIRQLKILGLCSLLFLLSTASFAVGLGDIALRSALNQPLHATIPLTDLAQIPPDALKATLAPEDAFKSVGLIKIPALSALTFDIVGNKGQDLLIDITTSTPITSPVMTFLVTLTWPGGEVTREYTLFLDPATYESPVKKQPQVTASVSGTSSPNAQTYGPTTPQDNLWRIASQHLPNQTITVPQMMWAIFKTNPQAFSSNNMNGLKSGQRLTIPSSTFADRVTDEAAKNEIHLQNTAWQAQTKTTVLPVSNSNFEDENTNQDNTALMERIDTPQSLQTNETDKSINEMQETLNALKNEVQIANEAMLISGQANQSLKEEIKDLKTKINHLNEMARVNKNDIKSLEQLNLDLSTQLAQQKNRSHIGILFFYIILFILFVTAIFFLSKNVAFLSKMKGFLLMLHKTTKSEQVSVVNRSLSYTPETIDSTQKKPEELNEKMTDLREKNVPKSTSMLDIVDEADVYIAYGRYEKAEALIQSTLAVNPLQFELQVKLIEIYITQEKYPAAEEQLRKMQAIDALPVPIQNKIKRLQEECKKNTGLSIAYETEGERSPEVNYIQKTETLESPVSGHPVEERGHTIEFEGAFTSTALASPSDAADLSGEDAMLAALNLNPSEETPLDISVLEKTPPDKSDAENNTQMNIDLAFAYYDMGDLIEAKQLIEHILPVCTDEQKSVIMQLMEKINTA